MKSEGVDRRSLDERCAALFAAGRRERAPDATRKRILSALHARSESVTAADTRRSRWIPALALAAVALGGLLVLSSLRPKPVPVPISAEAPRPTAPKNPIANERIVAPVPAPSASSVRPRPAPRPSAGRKPASLGQELASMRRARAALGRGDARSALAELDQFGRSPGWRRLAVEASLLRIEALARAGRGDEARSLARRFVAQHPNNPLVDRAQTFAEPPPSGAPEETPP